MAINKKLIHFKNKEKFEKELANGNILDTSIVFILETKEIYTHGLFYDGNKVDLSSIENSILNILDTKLDNISDLEIIRNGSVLGATSVQPSNLANVAKTGSYDDLTNKPTIPSAVTESTISEWGFTKNTGTYSKPSTGIPKTDLTSDVQSSLNKADSALQEHQSLSDYATKAELNKKAEGSIESLDNGGIKVTINGVSKNFLPSTPSGDPMHYLFVGHGAKYNEDEDYILETEWAPLVDDVEYNATYGLNKITGTKVKTLEYQGVNYDVYEQNHYYLGEARKVWVVGVKSQNGTLVWDDTKVIHRKGYWLFNSIGDLTNQDMADIVNQGTRYLTTPFCYAYHGSQYSEYKGRTNLPSYGGNDIIKGTNLQYAFYHNFSEVAIIGTSHNSETVFPILNLCISGPIRHMVGGLVKMVRENGEYRGDRMSTIRIHSSAKSFKMNSSYISKKSILQAIETEAASSLIVFNLTTSAFNRINNEPDIIEALSNHPNVTLAKI